MNVKESKCPLPLISSAFELLKGAKVFTKLDLRNAYHLVRIRDWDEWKMAFSTPSSHYEYLVMPLGNMLNHFFFANLDKILIFSPDEKTHVQHEVS